MHESTLPPTENSAQRTAAGMPEGRSPATRSGGRRFARKVGTVLAAFTAAVGCSAPATQGEQNGGVGGGAAATTPAAERLSKATPRPTASTATARTTKPAPTKPLHFNVARDVTCKGLKTELTPPHTLLARPIIQKKGYPDAGKFFTVADVVEGENYSAHHTFVSQGLGSPVEVPLESAPDISKQVAAVGLYYYPGSHPDLSNPAEFSIENSHYKRVPFACGNAVVAWSLPGHTSIG